MERSIVPADEIELVFIPIAVMGHFPSMVQIAQKLVSRCPNQISITILLMRFPYHDNKVESFTDSLKQSLSTSAVECRISLVELPKLHNPPDINSKGFLTLFTEAYKPIVKETLLERKQLHQSLHSLSRPKRLAGLVLDMCCTTMIDVANELSAASYIYFASGAPCLRLMLHFGHFGVPDITPALQDGQLPSMDNKTCPVLEVEGFKNPVPATVWPELFLDEDNGYLEIARRHREAKGILVNTFAELESDLIRSFNSNKESNDDAVPQVYPVGPIINLKNDSNSQKSTIMSWLDSHPPSSVVFLCFGSRGTFRINQVKEIATGLERSGHRFLWSLRKEPAGSHGGSFYGGVYLTPEEYEDFTEVLPEGFLNRTAEIGKVIGWAPQASVLGHKAVGAFVSHCGWNSTLESLWSGVPLVTWPMYAEQQLNAFALVVELGLAVEIKMGYNFDPHEKEDAAVPAEVIEKAIRRVMGKEGEGKRLREKAKQISEMAKKSLEIGGSSYESMGGFIEDLFRNIS